MNEKTRSETPTSTVVGYCNPPQHTRFKKGESGNLRGRPKGTLNLATVLARTLREKVVVNEHGKRKTVTKLEAAIKQLMNKAASGDLKALKLLAALVRSSEERSTPMASPAVEVDEADEKVIFGILKRLEAANEDGERADDEPRSK